MREPAVRDRADIENELFRQPCSRLPGRNSANCQCADRLRSSDLNLVAQMNGVTGYAFPCKLRQVG